LKKAITKQGWWSSSVRKEGRMEGRREGEKEREILKKGECVNCLFPVFILD
jgi:hypothetical protein